MKNFRETLRDSCSEIRPVRVISAFTANVDKVVRLSSEHEEILSRVLLLEDLPERRSIRSLEELLRALASHVIRGKGAEWLIENRSVCEDIERIFRFSERLGGNAAHVANILSVFDFEVLLNIPRPTPKQVSFFHENVRCFDSDGKLRHPTEIVEEGEDIVHYIFEFIEGSTLRIGGGSFRVPQTGRFIASYDVPSPLCYLQNSFVKFSPEYARRASGAFLSGFHLLRTDEGFESFISLLNSWGSGLKIHLELGDFESEEVLRRVIQEIVPLVSSLGMNELELQRVSSLLSVPCGEGPASLVSAAENLFRALEVPIVVHHPLFSFSLGDEISTNALALGTLIAAMKASLGDVEKEHIESFILSSEFHPLGLKAVKRIEKRVSAAFPAIHVKNFRSSVGLGDSFSAGLLISLLSAPG